MGYQRLFPVVVLAAVVLAGCGTPTAPTFGLRGGVLATFSVSGEEFRVFVRDPAAADALLRLHRGAAGVSRLFPNGRILAGPGARNHNAPFRWHLDPDQIEMVELAIELCDGRPSYVEAHADEYIDVVGRYCPWGARLTSLVDLR